MISRAEDQLLRGHVTEALFTLKLDTPVRHCVKGWKIIKAGQSCKESGREDAPRARSEHLQCNKNTAPTQFMSVTTITKLYKHSSCGPCCTAALSTIVGSWSGAVERLAVVLQDFSNNTSPPANHCFSPLLKA